MDHMLTLWCYLRSGALIEAREKVGPRRSLRRHWICAPHGEVKLIGLTLPVFPHAQVEAIKVLLEHVPEGGLQRASDFATKVGGGLGAAPGILGSLA